MRSHFRHPTVETVFPTLIWRAIASASGLVAGVALTLTACGGGDKPPAVAGPSGDGGADAGSDIDFSCLPDCYRQAFETCQAAGTCTSAIDPASSAARLEAWSCFGNGVTFHLSQTMENGGTISSTEEFSTSSGLCRRLEIMEGTSGGFFTMKDGNGVTLATAKITSYPGITIACGNMEMELDRTTPCGRAATLELAKGVSPEMLGHCSVGACPH